MYKPFLKPFLFMMDPERAHHLTAGIGQSLCRIPILGKQLIKRNSGVYNNLSTNLFNVTFKNPIGIAAGFDKNARYTELMNYCRFGYLEYGSITAIPSNGNPKPRLFRLTNDRALINRMGLNNQGSETICRSINQIKAVSPWLFDQFPTGINIAKTHDPAIMGDRAIEDYLSSYRHARTAADYITLNISCPNTREGKTFEDVGALTDLMQALSDIRTKLDPPLLIKWSPDISFSDLEQRVSLCEQHAVDGYVVSNTSSKRSGLKTQDTILDAIGNGGLSGAPLFQGNKERIRFLRSILPKNRVLIGCGGIDSPEKALDMLTSGANLVQLYTGFIYEGPGLIPAILTSISQKLDQEAAPDLQTWLLEQWSRG